MLPTSKRLLSGSSHGVPVKVAATATVGTTVHQAVNSTTQFDEIFLWAVNTSASAVKLTIEWGTGTAADGNLEQTIAPESGLVVVAPGLCLRNNLLVTAFAGTTNVILIHGWVLRHTP